MKFNHALLPLLVLAVVPWSAHSALIPLPVPDLPLLPLEACYGDLGCFNNRGPFFHPVNRPIVLLPQSPETINTRFNLYTRKNPDTPASIEYNDVDTIKKSNFDGRKPTMLVIHGFMGWDDLPWMNRIRTALLEKFDCNVIQIGWAGGSMTLYMQATSNTRVVGAVVARMLLWLEKEHSLNRQTLHIIGFSLGAQVAGFAGERMRLSGHPLNRITGLDPAGPYFEGTDPVARLDPTDAEFVDVVHTDAGHWHIGLPLVNGGFGTDSSVGHVDFFVNGGHHQPGCVLQILGCDHARAPDVYVETIRNPDKSAFAAMPCSSYEDFLAGACKAACPSDGCVAMGYHADRHRARFVPGSGRAAPHYLLTGDTAPFALVHYHVAITLSSSSPTGRIGELQLRLVHPSRPGGQCWPQRRQPKVRNLSPGSTHTVAFACDWPAGGQGSALHIGWKDWADHGPLSWLVGKRNIAVDAVTLTEMVSGTARRYCEFNSITSGESKEGKPC